MSIPLPLRFDRVTVPAILRIGVEGSGTMPLDAERVRVAGWDRAWNEWAVKQAGITSEDARAAVASSRLWRAIFPERGASPDLDLLPRMKNGSGPLRVARADIDMKGADAAIRAAAADELARESPSHGRVVVLGLDALDWTLVDDLTRRGLMPNLRKLLQSSAQANLEVMKPLISPVVWTTAATGVLPEEHGVLDFLERDSAGGAPRPVSSASRKAPALWEMTAAAGRSTAVVGWWATYPAVAPSNARIYSDRLTEQLVGLTSWVPGQAAPASAEAVARKLVVRADQIKAEALLPFAQVSDAELTSASRGADAWDAPAPGLAKLLSSTLTVEALTDHEVRSGASVIFAYLEGTDTVGHLFGQYRPPAMPDADPNHARRFSGVVDRYHQHVDAWIGRIAGSLGPQDTLVILSDHGFTWGSDRPRVPAGAHTATAVWWHKAVGVFIVSGPGVPRSNTRQQMGILDVAPTLLALAGLPRGAELRGRVPAWLSSASRGNAQAVRYDLLLPPQHPAVRALPPEARDEELAKLRALGYIAGPSTSSARSSAGVERYDRAEARRLTNLGTSRSSSGDDAGAEAAFRAAVAADPTYAAGLYNLSLAMRKRGGLDDADTTFWRSVENGIADRELAVVRLALDYGQRGDVSRARAVLAEGRKRFPSSAAIWINSGVFLGEHGDLDGSRTCLEHAVELAPASAEAHRNLGVALLATGHRDEAIRELREALRRDPSLTVVQQQLNELEHQRR